MAQNGDGGKSAPRKARRSRAESRARRELAACYRMFYRRGMDDLIYTHLSVRIPDRRDRYLFIGFGQLFDDVTASSLMTVDIEGSNVGRTPGEVNPAGWVVHRTVFEAVPEAESVMHLHTVPASPSRRRRAGCCRSTSSRSPMPAGSPTTTMMAPVSGRPSRRLWFAASATSG